MEPTIEDLEKKLIKRVVLKGIVYVFVQAVMSFSVVCSSLDNQVELARISMRQNIQDY